MTQFSKVFSKHWVKLMAMENVVSVGVGIKKIGGRETGTIAIVCGVEKKVPLAQLRKKDVIPMSVEGIMTDVIETGKIKALKARTDRWRPAPGGVSIGHEWITAGTLGCVATKDGELFLLSNNHVFADSNNAPIGSAILQPGKYDQGTLADRIAKLAEFVPINWIGGEGCQISTAIVNLLNSVASAFKSRSRVYATSTQQIENLVDAAIAKPYDDTDVSRDILEIGLIEGLNFDPTIGLSVQKSGRTTAVTVGNISQTEVITQVEYGDGKIALFVDQLLIEKADFSAPGDSGSAVLDFKKRMVGLLFAGSDQVTVVNRADHIWNLLNLDR